MNCVSNEINLVPVGFVLTPVNPVSIDPLNPLVPQLIWLVLDSKAWTLEIEDTPTWSVVSNDVGFKKLDLSWTNLITFVSTSYAATNPLAVPAVTTWLIVSPIWGVPLAVDSFKAPTDENVGSVNNEVDPIDVGFFRIPIWEKLVLTGKSFVVDVSNLANTKTLSDPNSL